MRFDDRLLTVLNQPAGDRHDAAVRWRQLVDLVARAGSNSSSPTVARALEEIRTEAGNVEEDLRSAAARAVAALPLPLGLLEYFASDQLSVSAPVLAAATLDDGQWRALLAVADKETRRFIETVHPEIPSGSVPPPTPPADLTDTLVEPRAEEPKPAAPPSAPGPSLHDVVARIERRRRTRAAKAAAATPAAGPIIPAGAPALFRWECGPSGEIAWVEGAPRGPLIGRSIARTQNGDREGVDHDVVRAFAVRAPFRDATMTVGGDGLLAGEWKISGVPAFEPADGRFAGYRGIALRDAAPAPEREASSDVLSDPDSLRELVHEIKTPLNAIIGFAEIIDGQYLGPADRRYRERAGEIVAQARLLLTAIDDLDFAAKIHSAGGTRPRVDLGELVERAGPSLRELAGAKGVELQFAKTPAAASAAVEPELADRLIFRLCAAVIERAEPSEKLRLSVAPSGEQSRVSIARPAAMRRLSEAQMFGGEGGGAGDGFSLRLVRGLARVAGGDVMTSPTSFALAFPRT